MKGRKYQRQELIDALRLLSQRIGRTPTVSDISNNKNAPHPATYHREFGSIKKAREAAGLNTNVRQGSPGLYSEAELREKLHQLGRRLNYVPSAEDIRRATDMPAATTYYRHYGSMRMALKNAGIRYSRPRMFCRVAVGWLMNLLRDYLKSSKEPWTERNS